jgi:hypothetical protein
MPTAAAAADRRRRCPQSAHHPEPVPGIVATAVALDYHSLAVLEQVALSCLCLHR